MRTVIAATLLAVVAQAQDQDAPSPAAITALIEKLGADDFLEREEATSRLIEIGKPAAGPVRPLLQSDDSEVRARARQVIDGIETPLRAAAFRLSATPDRKAYKTGEVPRVEVRVTNVEDFAVVALKWDAGTVRTSVWSELIHDGAGVHFSDGSLVEQGVQMQQEVQVQQKMINWISSNEALVPTSEVRFSRADFVTVKPGESIPVACVEIRGVFPPRNAERFAAQPLKPGKYKLKAVFQLLVSVKDDALRGRCRLYGDEATVAFDGNAGALLRESWTGRIEAETEFEVTKGEP